MKTQDLDLMEGIRKSFSQGEQHLQNLHCRRAWRDRIVGAWRGYVEGSLGPRGQQEFGRTALENAGMLGEETGLSPLCNGEH